MIEEAARITELRTKYGLHRTRADQDPIRSKQVIGIEKLVENRFFFLADEMGYGKTRQAIEAAHVLFTLGRINHVVVIAPASVRRVWYHQELGELQKYLWESVPSCVIELHSEIRKWAWKFKFGENYPVDFKILRWTITNYEYIRRGDNILDLLPFIDQQTLVIFDESSAVKNYGADQTKAAFKIRKEAGRVYLLNGTPIANNPLDLFSQGNLLSPKILECPYITHYKGRYAQMGGYEVHGRPTQITGWKNLEDLQNRFAPYILHRKVRDDIEMPAELPPVILPVPLTPKSWDIYRQMRDDMVVWLNQTDTSMAAQAVTKVLRLSQITSGFLGGIEGIDFDDADFALMDNRPDRLLPLEPFRKPSFEGPVREIGREKLDLVLERFETFLEQDPNIKLLVWCRFVPEVHRMIREVMAMNAKRKVLIETGMVIGGSKKVREHAMRLLDPRTAAEGPTFVAGTYGTGSLGLNFTACHTQLNCSYDTSMFKFLQSSKRIDRPGQVESCWFGDIVATGPKGQKTIDYTTIMARQGKIDIANWTTSAWSLALMEE